MIFFDIDGTLVDHEGAERAAAIGFQQEHKEVFAESPEDFVRRWHLAAEKHVKRYLAGELSFQGQRRARLRELFAHHKELSDAEADGLFQAYLDYYEQNWRLYPDVECSLTSLRLHGLGVVSNGDSRQQRQKLQVLGIARFFSVVVISGDVGISKPEVGIFTVACKQAGISPSQCFYVGDNLETDAEASMCAGVVGIWLNRNGIEASTEILTIQSLVEVEGVVGKTA